MPKSGTINGGGRLHYGWVIVAAAFLIIAVNLGIRYSYGVFFTTLQAEFQWNRASTSALYSVYLFLASLIGVLGGWATDRYGPKVVLALMGSVTGLALFLTGLVQSIWQIYFTYSILLAAGSGGIGTLLLATVSRWFSKNRASAMGIMTAGTGLGTLVLAPLSAWLISAYSWRTAYMVTAVIAWAVTVPLALLMKKSPSQAELPANGGFLKAVGEKQFHITEALRNRDFWFIFLALFAYSYCLHVVLAHVVPRAEDLGMSTVRAASIISVLSAVNIFARIFGGRLADRLNNKKLVAVAFASLHAVALVWLVNSTEMWMFYLFAAAYGLAYGGIDPVISALIPDIFGLRNVGVIMGAMVVGWGSGAALGPYLSGLIFDLSGSYSFAFLSGALIMVPAALCIYYLRAPRQSSRV